MKYIGKYVLCSLISLVNMFIGTSIVDLCKKIDFQKFVGYSFLSENGRNRTLTEFHPKKLEISIRSAHKCLLRYESKTVPGPHVNDMMMK